MQRQRHPVKFLVQLVSKQIYLPLPSEKQIVDLQGGVSIIRKQNVFVTERKAWTFCLLWPHRWPIALQAAHDSGSKLNYKFTQTFSEQGTPTDFASPANLHHPWVCLPLCVLHTISLLWPLCDHTFAPLNYQMGRRRGVRLKTFRKTSAKHPLQHWNMRKKQHNNGIEESAHI